MTAISFAQPENSLRQPPKPHTISKHCLVNYKFFTGTSPRHYEIALNHESLSKESFFFSKTSSYQIMTFLIFHEPVPFRCTEAVPTLRTIVIPKTQSNDREPRVSTEMRFIDFQILWLLSTISFSIYESDSLGPGKK